MTRPTAGPYPRDAGRPHEPLLAGYRTLGRPLTLEDHRRIHGPLPRVAGARGHDRLIQVIDDAGLTGRGGAAFPTARKLRTVAAARRRPVVVVNGGEGEPASGKDRLLLTVNPHLVLDGAALAAAALGAKEIIVAVHEGGRPLSALGRALTQRRRAGIDVVPARVTALPARYVASEESALVNWINAGDARPTATPPRPYERGVAGRPTLISNAETYAHLALIARYGPDWFRSSGTALFTIGGAVTHPGVVEAPPGTTVTDLLRLAGGPAEPLRAVLTGGYGGAWLPATHLGTPTTPKSFAEAGAVLGAGILLALPVRSCPIAESARVLRWLANQAAGQCGPCVFGLPAIAADLTAIAGGRADPAVYDRLARRLTVVTGRGACRHPDGAVRFARSTLRVFHPHLRTHEYGATCRATAQPPVLPLPPGW